MRRPTGVTVIACLFLLSGIYYCAIAGPVLRDPRAALEGEFAILALFPYCTLIVGLVWGLVGWGLFRLHDWARWAAQIMLAVGVAWVLPSMYFNHIHFSWRVLVRIAELILRLLPIGYLFAPKVMDAFLNKQSGPDSVPASS